MLRFWLLGGRWPSVPWMFFVVLGGACLAAGVLFVFMFTLWSNYYLLGTLEIGIFAGAGIGLLVAGALRRKHDLERTRIPLGPGRLREIR